MKQLIEKKEFIYYLYKGVESNNFQLSIPLPDPQPGFDVLYELSPEEIELYLSDGIGTLKGRIKDMNLNYKSYTLISWR